jgi:hypothetical protein
MALVVKDRVQVSSSTTGTGTLTLGVALGGFQDFSVIGDGNTTYYAITNNGEWEVGIGTYTASGTTLSRDTVLESSNSGNKINLSGTSLVFCTYPAEKGLYLDANGNAIGLGTPVSVNLTNATNLPLTTGVTGVLPEANGGTGTTVGYNGFKNRIINGAMQIDQRNAGASVTPVNGEYTLDRWRANLTQGSKLNIQQNAGSVTPPVGFTNYLGVTSTSAYNVLNSDFFFVDQRIEGLNIADLGWGTANAQTVTLSFWVRSSLTGTFGGSFCNAGASRTYAFSFTILSANTWEQKSITIAGDTTGTWLTNNGIGIILRIGLGVGSTFSGTAGSWSGSNFVSATGATSVVGTNGATFYITGVQLEKGSNATSFDYRPFGTELALCQRYYYKNKAADTGSAFGSGFNDSTTVAFSVLGFPVSMRIAPTALEQSGTASHYRIRTSGEVNTTCNAVPTYIGSTNESAWTAFSVASGLTAGQGCIARANNAAAFLAWSAEI